MRTGMMTELGAAKVLAPSPETQYCMVDGCYRETRSNGYCEKHYLNLRRTGHLRPQKKTTWDWVSDAAGPECGVCGRSVYEHGVTEFCEQVARAS